jgi:hypothetical protein
VILDVIQTDSTRLVESCDSTSPHCLSADGYDLPDLSDFEIWLNFVLSNRLSRIYCAPSKRREGYSFICLTLLVMLLKNCVPIMFNELYPFIPKQLECKCVMFLF